MVNLYQLKTLHSVQRHGGIHAAAKALHLSPSAVSQQIKALAGECGFPLVEHCGRGIKLTERGTMLANVGDQISDFWERSVSGIERHGRLATPRRIKVGAFPSALTSCVLPALSSAGELPFDVELLETSPFEARTLVNEGALDVAVSIQESRTANETGLHVTYLRHDPFVLVGPPRRASQKTASASPLDLSTMRWVLPKPGSDCDRLIETHLVRHEVTVRPVGRTDDWSLAQAMAAELQAVTYIPVTALDRRVNVERITNTPIPPPARTIVLLAKPTAMAMHWFGPLRARLKRAYSAAGTITAPEHH